MKLMIPGKTFLVGEYSVLVGGKALGVATSPYFEADLDSPKMHPVHENSAAGLFLKTMGHSSLEINTVASQFSVGGFGFSTAEFITAWFKKTKARPTDVSGFMKPMVQEYRDLFDIDEKLKKTKPSGADLVIQLLGKIAYFDPQVVASQSCSWPFTDLGFDIISTGIKIATHDHVASLDLNQIKKMIPVSDRTVDCFLNKKEDEFIDHLRLWSQTLVENNLQLNHSIELKQIIEKCDSVILAKPNGALGADTITVFYRQKHKKIVREYLNEQKILNLTGLDQLADGTHYVD